MECGDLVHLMNASLVKVKVDVISEAKTIGIHLLEIGSLTLILLHISTYKGK